MGGCSAAYLLNSVPAANASAYLLVRSVAYRPLVTLFQGMAGNVITWDDLVTALLMPDLFACLACHDTFLGVAPPFSSFSGVGNDSLRDRKYSCGESKT